MTKNNEEKAMINKNDVLILKCIMALNNCDMVSAIKFAGHNQTCYKIAMAVANAKDDENQAERQALQGVRQDLRHDERACGGLWLKRAGA